MMTSERSLHPIWSGIVLLLIGSACGKGDRPIVPDGTDSAGVEIINNRTPDRALAWSFREILRLGGDDAGPASFYEIDRNLVAVDERGHLYVLDGQDFTVAEFDAEGGAMRTLGGEGGGPGQFQRPFGVAVTASGRVVVNDYGKQSLVRFAPDGTVLDQMPALLSTNRSGRKAIMSEEERAVYESLPDPVVIYRGYLPRRNLRGYGWTLNRRCAEWFAVRFSDVGRAAEGKVARQDVLAYFNERNEEEILVDPANVRVKRRWDVTAPVELPSRKESANPTTPTP